MCWLWARCRTHCRARVRFGFEWRHRGSILATQKSVEMYLGWVWLFRASFRTVTARGVVDLVGEGVSRDMVGQRVWCFGAQSYRAFGTAAEYTVVPADHVALLPEGVSFEAGACLGIPGITAHRAVHAGGPVRGKTVLVQGGGWIRGFVCCPARAFRRRAGDRNGAECRRGEGCNRCGSRRGGDQRRWTGRAGEAAGSAGH